MGLGAGPKAPLAVTFLDADLCALFWQLPELGSSEDERFSSVTRRTSLTRVLKHSTPEGAAPSWHSGLLVDVPSCQEGGSAGGSPLPVRSPWDLPSSPGELSPKAPLRKRRLSTIRASEVSSGQPGSNSDPFALEEDPPVPASVTRRRRQQQQRRSPRARRSPPNPGLPGIPNTARRRPRDPKRLAAAVGPDPDPSPGALGPCPRPPGKHPGGN